MAVAFFPSQEMVRGDLDIFIKNSSSTPTTPNQITYAIYYVDPGPPESEVLIGADSTRVPVNPAVGEYYASLLIPAGATIGTYRIRWTIQETVGAPLVQVVQEFAVVTSTTLVASPYTTQEQEMIDSLRVMLRDNCLGGEETVELDVGGTVMVVRLDDLWEFLHISGSPRFLSCASRRGPGVSWASLSQQRDRIRATFRKGTLRVRSMDTKGVLEWKAVDAVHRKDVPGESILEIATTGGSLIVTGGHRVYIGSDQAIEAQDLSTGHKVVHKPGQSNQVTQVDVLAITELADRQFMYDLTVADNHNLVLHRSGVVVHNCPDRNYHFRPPEHEADIGAYNQVFGYIWEDAELYQYLLRAIDWWDMFPPSTHVGTIPKLVNETPSWRTAIYYGGMMFALMALAINWVSEEFSVVGGTKVKVFLPDGREVDIPISELYTICHEDG